jgi:hypothetical protein
MAVVSQLIASCEAIRGYGGVDLNENECDGIEAAKGCQRNLGDRSAGAEQHEVSIEQYVRGLFTCVQCSEEHPLVRLDVSNGLTGFTRRSSTLSDEVTCFDVLGANQWSEAAAQSGLA